MLALRLDRATADRLDAVTARLPISRHRVALLAMGRGLAEIERDPTVLIGPPPKGRSAPARSGARASKATAKGKGAR
jgi:hypothetical protein